MTLNDLERFTRFMHELASGCKEKDPPGADKIKMYFVVLMDMEFDDIRENAFQYLRTKPNWFPGMDDLRGVERIEHYADQAYLKAKQIVSDYFSPDFPQSSLKVVKRQLDKVGLGGYFELIDEFGYEMLKGTNPTATRAQFKRAFINIATVGKMRQLPAFLQKAPQQITDGSPRVLGEVAKKLLDKNRAK